MNEVFKIKNYQIIKNGELTFRPGITLITGPSNNGKSSIFKAYKQLIYNLSGNTYINQFADKCTLTLTNDKYSIEYNKTKTKSSYDITEFYPDDYENRIHIDKLGANQIDKIKEITKIDKAMGYNFWDQLEKPFLISETNREQFLLLQESPISSNLINIQENIKSDIKSLKDNLLINQGSLNVLTEDITKYENILKFSGEANDLSDKVKNLANSDLKITKIESGLAKLNSAAIELEKINDVADITIDFSVTALVDRFNYFNTQIANMINQSKLINDAVQDINGVEDQLNNLENLLKNKFNICPLCGNSLPHNE